MKTYIIPLVLLETIVIPTRPAPSLHPRKFERKIRVAWLIGAALGLVCLALSRGQPLVLLEACLVIAVSYGIYAKSRFCAITLFIGSVGALIQFLLIFFRGQELVLACVFSLVLVITSCYIFFQGLYGVFAYHSANKISSPRLCGSLGRRSQKLVFGAFWPGENPRRFLFLKPNPIIDAMIAQVSLKK
jgi:hypothetical protein